MGWARAVVGLALAGRRVSTRSREGWGLVRVAHVVPLTHPPNDRRKKMGLLPRSIRAAIIGYPNVGKSALINKLLGRRLAKVSAG
jgi:ribosome biogenesis GTPase A